MPLHHRNYMPDAPAPLRGVRVLDLSRLVAGNTVTQMLGDFGAEVVKVEPHDGDTLRGWTTCDVETSWKLYSRNKRSLCIDLRHPKTHEVLMRLIEKSNVLVESFRPGTLERMGLDPEELLRRNPSLVIVRISGWGQTGPYSPRPGFGTLVEGISGFASFNGFSDREPVLPPTYMADSYAGLYGAAGVLIALRQVEVNGGQGQVIDLPLLDPVFTVLGPQAANYRLSGKVKPRTGSRSTNSGPRNVYRTQDQRYVALSASTQKMAARLFASIGRPELIQDPRYATNAERVRHAEDLDQIIGEFVMQRSQADNVAFFEAAEVTIGPIYDISQILDDPHFVDREVLADYPDDQMGSFPMHHVVPRLSGTPGSVRTPAPKLGQDNVDVLRSVGFTSEEIDLLQSSGALHSAATQASAEPAL
ncbi:CoA transferase [Variovorax rhizosphaerae]|uniref:CoA transferase n=1 Tax=Variovorax rhizosphaerae TaxID=1836200 RepID=A0ABU8WR85_9BURK